MSDSSAQPKRSMLRVFAQVALLCVLLIGVYAIGSELGERRVHRHLAAVWDHFFTEPVVADPADPFATDPFGPVPNGADPFGGPSGADPFGGPFVPGPFMSDPFSGGTDPLPSP